MPRTFKTVQLNMNVAAQRTTQPPTGFKWIIHGFHVVHITGTDSEFLLLDGTTEHYLSYITLEIPSVAAINCAEIQQITIVAATYLIQVPARLPFEVPTNATLSFAGGAGSYVRLLIEEIEEISPFPTVSSPKAEIPKRLSGWQ